MCAHMKAHSERSAHEHSRAPLVARTRRRAENDARWRTREEQSEWPQRSRCERKWISAACTRAARRGKGRRKNEKRVNGENARNRTLADGAPSAGRSAGCACVRFGARNRRDDARRTIEFQSESCWIINCCISVGLGVSRERY